MPINIALNGVQVGVGHGETPEGDPAMGITFLDPMNGISVQVTFIGEGIDSFMAQLKRPGSIEVLQSLPAGLRK